MATIAVPLGGQGQSQEAAALRRPALSDYLRWSVDHKIIGVQYGLASFLFFIIGGAMAYTFLKARGRPVGRSLVEDALVDAVRGIEHSADAGNVRLELPGDHVVADRLDAGAAHAYDGELLARLGGFSISDDRHANLQCSALQKHPNRTFVQLRA